MRTWKDCLSVALTTAVFLFSLALQSQEKNAASQSRLEPKPSDSLVFQDDFESGDLSRWDGAPTRFAIESDRTKVFSGARSLRGTLGPGVPLEQLNKWFMPGYDEIYVKFKVLFETGYVDKGMHFVVLFGDRIDNKWSGSGQAGIKPNGKDYFYVGLDPEYPTQHGAKEGLWPFMFYSYWPDMSCPSDYDPINRRNCFGNYLVQSNPKANTVAGVWHEIVIHIRLNTPGSRNASEVLWIDGTKKHERLNLRFRDTTDIRLNQFSIQLYETDPPKLEHVWFDDVKIWRPVDTAPGGSSVTH